MSTTRTAAVLLLGLMAAGTALADEQVATTAEPARGDADALVLAPAVPAPHWTATGAQRLDGYQMSVARGWLGVGMRFEPRILPLRPTEPALEPTTLTLPAVSLELRSASAQPIAASSLAERALRSAGESTSTSKVGIEWKPAQSQIFFRGGVGMRLNGDDSVVMRLRKGTVGVYMSRSF